MQGRGAATALPAGAALGPANPPVRERSLAVKRTALVRRTPLARTGRLRSAAWTKSVRRRTGFDRRTLALIRDRDARCQGCGAGPGQVRESGLRLEVHHRLAKSRGGKDDISNGLLLCGLGNAAGCHRRVDHERAWAILRGLAVATGCLPANIPVTDWADRVWLLDDDGQRWQL
jgi:hypothetical protein